ncbi:recombinase RecT [Streptomyces sp. NBC_00124]|uniref:recombinase RecT n=1 Tax=Streptomyces sp. NBC_00124 TaxID=2975662 RepID=UPI00225762E2|nr:recombinase RecT [Streptomyces sp. NBC_00124]MCX5362911.1 recombinase RecT [Streptomyces sp. NBC_00124]
MTVVSTLPTTAPAAAPAVRGGALSLAHMSPYEAWQFCESLAQTPLLPDAYRKQPASVLWAMEYGRALGLDVVTTITTIHVIKGKPTQSADLMLGRARTAGHRVRIKSERTRCEVRIQRSDDPDDESVVEWTLDDAVTAGLCTLRDNRPYSRDQKNQPQPWEKFPRAMLRARAIAEAVRIACPEVLHGAIYTPEELGAVVDQEGNPVVVERADVPQMTTATVVQSTPNPAPATSPRDYLAEAVATVDAEQLAAIVAAAVEAGAPAEYTTCLDEIRRAHEAPNAATVRELHRAAKERGAPPEQLTRLADIGATKPGARPSQQAEQPTGDGHQGEAEHQPTGPAPHSVSDAVAAEGAIITAAVRAEHPDVAERAAAEAEQRLRLAASRAGMQGLDAQFEAAYGLPIAKAPAHQIHAMAEMIERAAQQ